MLCKEPFVALHGPLLRDSDAYASWSQLLQHGRTTMFSSYQIPINYMLCSQSILAHVLGAASFGAGAVALDEVGNCEHHQFKRFSSYDAV